MRLGEMLVGQGLVSQEQVDAAVERQKREGGRLGNHLVAIGAITVDKLLLALRSQRDVDSTLDMCARTFQRWHSLYGADHPNTQRARYSYARAMLAAGRANDALKYAEAALAGIRAALGENHAWTDDALQLVADARHAVTATEPMLAPAE